MSAQEYRREREREGGKKNIQSKSTIQSVLQVNTKLKLANMPANKFERRKHGTNRSKYVLFAPCLCSAGNFQKPCKSLLAVPTEVRVHGRSWRYMAILVLGTDLISEHAPNLATVTPLPAYLQPHCNILQPDWGGSFVPASLAVVAFAQICLTAPGFSTGAKAGASHTNGQQGGDESYFTERSGTIVQLMPKHSSPTFAF